MISKTTAGGTTQYIWDYENRLKQVNLPSGQVVNYKYDAFGRRTERNVNGTDWTRFTYDGLDVMLDQNGDGTSVTYLNGLGIDNKLRQTVNGQAQYFLNDHLGSTNALTDATGNIIASTNYDSFGNVSNSSFPTRYQYTGREYDELTGLHYYRARWYSAKLGRFISEDPIGFKGGDVNLFAYVKNKPLKFTDPKGTLPIIPIAIAGGVISIEGGLHLGLGGIAKQILPNDPYGRKKHCWVNCMSTRIHLGNPAVVNGLGFLQEGVNISQYSIQYSQDGNGDALGNNLNDSLGDLMANQKGQMSAYIIWKGCKELCENCQ